MTRLPLIAASLLALATVAWAQDAQLVATDTRDGLYARATLTIPADKLNGAPRAIRIHDSLGGPTWILPVLPNGQGELETDVTLPALRSHQDYRVDTLAAPTADAPALNTFTLSIVWPTAQVNTAAIINPAFATPFDVRQPTWSRRTKLTLLLGALVIMLVGAGMLCVRRPLYRIVGLLMLATIATTGVRHYLAQQPAIIVHPTSQSDALVLTARRSEVFHYGAPGIPIYLDVSGWIEDRSIISPDGIDVPISPGEVKLILPLRDED